MADARFFIEELVSTHGDDAGRWSVVAPREDIHHMVNVLRIAVGERIEVVTRADWRAYRATVASVERGSDPSVVVAGVEALEQPDSPHDVTLAFGIAKGDKTDTIVRQAVELGVGRIIPVMFSRSVVRLAGDKASSRQARLQAIAEAAAKQAHHPRIPVVDTPRNSTSLASLVSEFDLTLVAWEETLDNELSDVVQRLLPALSVSGSPVRVLVVVGPEGGISAPEVDVMLEAGAVAVSIGPTILRVDTACAVATAITFDALRRASRDRS